MRAIIPLIALLLVGCEDTYRYPCQDPENWKKPECNRPACEVDGFCWDKLSGVDPKEVSSEQTENVEPVVENVEPAAEPAVESNGE